MDVMLEQAREEARLEEHRARTRMKDVPVAGDPGAADRAVMQRRKAVEARTAVAARGGVSNRYRAAPPGTTHVPLTCLPSRNVPSKRRPSGNVMTPCPCGRPPSHPPS